MSTPADGTRLWQRFRLLLVALVVCRGLVFLCVLPLFEGWDEYEHVGYVVHVQETGRPAVLGETNVPASLLAEVVRYPQPKCVVDLQLGRLGALDYAAYWKSRTPPSPRPGTMELYQAQHYWWYYRLAAPLFTALGGVENLRVSVAGLRLVNLALVAAAVWVALGAIGRLVHDPRLAALIGLAIASHPLFLINSLRVANDAPAVLLATLAVAACLRLERARWWPLHFVAIGLLTGLAVLAKAVNLALVPFVACCWLGFVVQSRLSVGRAIAAAVIVAASFLAVTQAELRSNLKRYGSPTAMQEAVVNRARGRTAADVARAALAVRWDKYARRLWLRDTFFVGGWSHQNPAPAFGTAYSIVLGTGLLGLAAAVVAGRKSVAAVFASGWTPAACAILCLCTTAGLGYHTVQSELAWGHSSTGPWYAASALPWFLVLAVGGALAWPVGRVRLALPWLLAAICWTAELTTVWGRMVLTYSGGATGALALHRLAVLQPRLLGTPTLLAASSGCLLCVGVFAVAWIKAGSRVRSGTEPRDAGLAGPHAKVSAVSIKATASDQVTG